MADITKKQVEDAIYTILERTLDFSTDPTVANARRGLRTWLSETQPNGQFSDMAFERARFVMLQRASVGLIHIVGVREQIRIIRAYILQESRT